ncbi:WYL domain-containing protein [Octadecabacter sp.]|nr:WYL domain-containing protein [Octadecabacter sp.]MDC1381116.1 WYL domain-containing protein [Octadecabacter sp.]
MKIMQPAIAVIMSIAFCTSVQAQSIYEALLCEAAETGRVVKVVYHEDASKDCLPGLVDVHQVSVGNKGQLYMHGWQTRGCTNGRDYESKRIFRFDRIQSAEIVDGEFSERSQSVKAEGWDGCIGSNCFIAENICE